MRKQNGILKFAVIRSCLNTVVQLAWAMQTAAFSPLVNLQTTHQFTQDSGAGLSDAKTKGNDGYWKEKI